MHPSEILQLISQCCLLGRFAKMLRLVGHDLELSLCCTSQLSIACNHAKSETQVYQLNQHILSIFCFRVASISEQCAACVWLSAWWWYLNACLPSALAHSFMMGYCATNWQSWVLTKLKVATKRGVQQCFTRLGLRNEGYPDTRSHGNLAVLTANGEAVIIWICSQIRLRR